MHRTVYELTLALLLLVPASASADYIHFPGTVGTGTSGGTGTFQNLIVGPGAVSITGGSGNGSDQISNVNVNGVLNVKAFGAKGDGTTDDTAAIQSAALAAGGYACVYFPAGNYLITQDLNFTSDSQSRCIVGDDLGLSKILCEDTGGNCLDLSGDDAFSIRNLQVQGGTSAANAPRTVILLARTDAYQGFGHTLENVWTSSYGPYTIYDYGAELGQWRNVRSNTKGVVISECNHAGITSRFKALMSPPTSMSMVDVVGGNLNSGGGINNCAVYLDNACTDGLIHDINFWGVFFGAMGGGGTALCDVAGGTNQILTLITVIGSRQEVADNLSTYRFINFANSYTGGLTLIQDNIGSTAQLTQPVLNFGGFVDNSQIQLDVAGGGMAPGILALSALGGRADRIIGFAPEAMSRPFYYGDAQGTNLGLGNSGNFIQWGADGYGHVDAGGMEANFRTQTINGFTSGKIVWAQPAHAAGYKLVTLTFQNFQNATTNQEWITYPVQFLVAPTAFGSCPAGMILSDGRQVTLPNSMSAPFTGQCMISGE